MSYFRLPNELNESQYVLTFLFSPQDFDTHFDLEDTLNYLFKDVNGALNAFVQEMKSMNEWDNIALIQTSDFARTLTPNGSNGTDHAWGGNYMLMGKVKR